MNNIVAIKFEKNARTYHFDAGDSQLKAGDLVIVSTAKGLQIGKVDKTDLKVGGGYEYSPVVRLATEADLEKKEKLLKQEKNALQKCREFAEEEGLKMRIVDAQYSFDKKTLTFNFFADSRVDFRELLKILAKTFKTRIELVQIGVRDKARETGGVGQCGQELCCSRFLEKLDNISINMAKNQDLALNPNKINGVCGRLLCCLNYENDYYKECKKQLPQINSKIKTKNGEGKVIKVDCLKMKYTVQTNSGEIVELDYQDGKTK